MTGKDVKDLLIEYI